MSEKFFKEEKRFTQRDVESEKLRNENENEQLKKKK